MNTDIIWMRHGTCHDGQQRPHAHARPGNPLTAQGAAEATHTAHALRARPGRPITVLTSPLLRAWQTAQIVARALDLPVGPPSELLTEWRAPTCVHGRAPSEYPPEYRHWRAKRLDEHDSALPGGESIAAFADRARHAAALADAAATSGTVVICSHRLLIGAVAALAHGASDPAEIFTAACDHSLKPAGTWINPACRAITAARPPRPAAPHGWRE